VASKRNINVFMKNKFEIVLIAICFVLASCSVTILNMNHSDGSTIRVHSEASADSSQIRVTLPDVQVEP
jgi:capsular polysaccharide biosynthesis protein